MYIHTHPVHMHVSQAALEEQWRPSPQGDLVAAGILSGNRNFEGRVHPNTRANYLASPPLVIAYAIAGTIRIDFEKEPLGEMAQKNTIQEAHMHSSQTQG